MEDLKFYEGLWLYWVKTVGISTWQGSGSGGGNPRPALPLQGPFKILFFKGSRAIGIFNRPLGILFKEQILKLNIYNDHTGEVCRDILQ